MTTPQRLAQYVQPNLHEARLAHQWAKIANRSQPSIHHRHRLMPMVAFSLLAVGSFAIGWRWRGTGLPTALNGTVIETGASGIQSLTLPDKSRVSLMAASQLAIDEYGGNHIQLSLKKGKASFEVTRKPQRRFTVLAAGYEISVIGTRFSVALGADTELQRVTVQVEQGKVNIRSRISTPSDRVLAAGQIWSASETAGPTTPAVVEPAVNADDASASTGGATSKPLASGSTKSSNPGPKELLESAEVSRINGNMRESAELLDKLRKTYRSDPRAGLAAFELGRLRMDILGDMNGSIEALRDAMRLTQSASIREDAQLRLVQLYNRQGNRTACLVEKVAYLEHYPHGAANQVVSSLCAP